MLSRLPYQNDTVSINDQLRALSLENFKKVKALRERWLSLILKADRLKKFLDRKNYDPFLSLIDTIEAERMLKEAGELDQQIKEIIS